MSAWTDYAEQLLPALVPAASGSGAPAWLLLAMAAHESGVPPVTYSSLTLQRNPWGIGCNGQPGSCALYPSLAAAGHALPGLLPANALTQASDPGAFMSALQADDWSGQTVGTYAQQVLALGPDAQEALQSLGVDVGTGQVVTGPVSLQTRPAGPPWAAGAVGALLVAAGLGLAFGGRR